VLNLWFVVRYERRLTTDTRTIRRRCCVFFPLGCTQDRIASSCTCTSTTLPILIDSGPGGGCHPQEKNFRLPPPFGDLLNPLTFHTRNVSITYRIYTVSRISAKAVLRIAIIFVFINLTFLFT